MSRLLSVENLCTFFDTEEGVVRAVDDVSLEIDQGETLAIVGESGSGKSVMAMSVMQLVASPPGYYASGKIDFLGEDLLSLDSKEIRKVRGNEIGMVFQEPMTSLNPLFTIGDQIIEAVLIHQKVGKDKARDIAIAALKEVAIAAPDKRIDQYPHELSGGMKQRAMIAMAIASRPKLLIADEPTTALDVTIQAEILDLLDQLKKENKMAIWLITHNLGIVAEYADRVLVMYAGKAIESARVEDLFERPSHPYTRGLLSSLPQEGEKGSLVPIPGTVPTPIDLPSGCTFHPRCNETLEICKKETPPFFKLDDTQGKESHCAACWLYSDQEKPTT